MNNKGMEFQTIATLLIIIVVIIGVIVLFTSQLGTLAGGLGGLSTATGEQGSQTEETIGSLPGVVTGTGCPVPPQCELKACLGKPCSEGVETGECLSIGVCGGWMNGPCEKNLDCSYSGQMCCDGTCITAETCPT
ncbi:MAG: hypothetical protein GOU97_00875 [Nanoarchaeota archaeon]|nr:hypothetical protein [Nanoarchaeota archaeon]